jgi:hypothetical protein
MVRVHDVLPVGDHDDADGTAVERGGKPPDGVASAVERLGGKRFGMTTSWAIVDMPDKVSMIALSVAVSASGFVRTKTMPLLTVEEAEEALAKSRTG